MLFSASSPASLPLLVFKYSGWAFSIIEMIRRRGHTRPGNFLRNMLLPLGISYFSLKSVGYLVDIYKGKISAEKSIITLGAYISFFPEMLVGPIDKTSGLLQQIKENRKPDWQQFQKGFIIFLEGCIEKMLVADRLGILVNTVYGDLYRYEGFVILIAICCYSLQIYFDFSGCCHMALGVGHMLGYELPENFRQPYLAVSIADFWRRWHMTLNDWLRDYIYIPLGGNRKGEFRKYLNTMIVFLVSGFWHGADWSFVLWGGINGLYQVIEALIRKVKNRFSNHQDSGSAAANMFRRIIVFILITITWVFFRAESLSQTILVFRKLFYDWNPWVLFDGTLFTLGLSRIDCFILAFSLLIMFVADSLRERNMHFYQRLLKQRFAVKCICIWTMILLILVFGIYGPGFDPADFIYQGF